MFFGQFFREEHKCDPGIVFGKIWRNLAKFGNRENEEISVDLVRKVAVFYLQNINTRVIFPA